MNNIKLFFLGVIPVVIFMGLITLLMINSNVQMLISFGLLGTLFILLCWSVGDLIQHLWKLKKGNRN